ncbi:MAG: hypothetical protein ACFFA4_02860 [Promethearchaeota archaeon]
MPLTPYHLGPGLFFGLVFLSFLDLPTFLIASVIVDIEPILVLYYHLELPLHGFFHSLIGGTIIGVVLTGIMILLRKIFNPVMSFLKLEQDRSFIKILLASLTGIYIHILFDSVIYTDIKPLYPLNFNPFLGFTSELGVSATTLCEYLFFAGLIVYMIRLALYYSRKQLRIIYMKPSKKFIQYGNSLILVGTFFMLWWLIDLLSAESNIRIAIIIILYIILPLIITAIIYDYMGIVKAVRKKNELDFLNLKNQIYNCEMCGKSITLEVKTCNECGAENIIRREFLEEIRTQEEFIEDTRKKILGKNKSAKKKKSTKEKYQKGLEDIILSNLKQKTKRLALVKISILIGNSHNEKLSWVRTQYYEKKRSINEIADELGEDIFIIEDYLGELKKQEKNGNQ